MNDVGATPPPGAAETPASAPSRASPWLKWGLVASLALNLAVVGILAGAWFFGPRHMGRWGGTPIEFGLYQFARQLPAERADRVRALLREGRKDFKPMREELNLARRKAAEALAAPDFTSEKLRAAMSEVGAADGRLRARGVDVVVRAAEVLTPEERKALSDRWRRRLGRFGGGGGRGEDSPPPPPAGE